MKSLIFIFFASACSASFAQTPKIFQLKSPDGHINIKLSLGQTTEWSVTHDSTMVILPSAISLTLANGEVLGRNAQVKTAKTATGDHFIPTPIYKKDSVHDNYNQLFLICKGGYGWVFRAYNDGVAYRFLTLKKDSVTIVSEEANFNFKEDGRALLPYVNDYRNKDKFTTSFEAHYEDRHLSAMPTDSLAFLPALINLGSGKKAVLLEADLIDYPGMYVVAGGNGGQGSHTGLHGVFAKYPTVETTGGYHNINYVVNGRADYIARSIGSRYYPWRVLVISTSDKQLADNDMMQRLAEPPIMPDIEWIKPGKVAWDWWNDWNLSHVDFQAGVNVPTYKYYIDFAAKNKLEYIIIDEGWSDDNDLGKMKLDVQQIVDYGKQKDVGVILWSTWYALHEGAEAQFAKFRKMGVKGFKIDFIDRDDQKMVRSLYQMAATAAKYHLLIDFHGMYKPSGFQRTFPNVINFEGVKGLENMKWGAPDQPVYDVSIPFIRMMSGPMDYTPGGMRNATRDAYRPVNSNPMTQGTRCHQMAMYTVFEAPLQMLADNPTIYQREQECTDYIASVPTVFDQTEALDGAVGDFICLARRKGTTWYAGAMTNWDPRALSIDLSFLGAGSYRAIVFEDGVNAGRDATDYKKTVNTVSAKDRLTINMASGGGWAARFERLD